MILKCLLHPLELLFNLFPTKAHRALIPPTQSNNRCKITNVPQNSTVGRRKKKGKKKKKSRGGAWTSECATRRGGWTGPGVSRVWGPGSPPARGRRGGHWHSTEGIESGRCAGWRGAARDGWRRAPSPVGRRGALRGGSGRLRAGGAADVQGGGAVCTMSYPGHPGAGGGYYPGGVSSKRGYRSLAAPGARGRHGRAREEALREDPRSRCSLRPRLAPLVRPPPHFILLPPVFLGALTG